MVEAQSFEAPSSSGVASAWEAMFISSFVVCCIHSCLPAAAGSGAAGIGSFQVSSFKRVRKN